MSGKIMTRAQLVPVLEQARAQQQRIVFTNGCFDLMHVGHVRYLQAAKLDITFHPYVHENIKRFHEGFRYDAHPMSMLASSVAALSAFTHRELGANRSVIEPGAHYGVARLYQDLRRGRSGFGAMLSFELAGGRPPASFARSLRRFTLAESLGGIESLVAHPPTMTHAAMSPEARKAAGIVDNLFRLSIGLEHVHDLIEDLARGLS